MSIESLTALNGAVRVDSAASIAPAARTRDKGGDFTAMLSQMAGDAVGAVQNAENVAMAGLRGQTDPRAVVEAVMQAEQNLQTSLAVRDKLVAAFQEITRMSI